MDSEWKKESCCAFLAIKNADEMSAFFDSLFTPSEFDELARRWQIVSRLIEGNSQRLVSKRTGVGIGTVERGARVIKYGTGILQKLHKRISSNRK
ncbi:MAG: Trp family transcriptional regulator [bacterium]